MKRYNREAKGGYYTSSFLTMNIDSNENFEDIMTVKGVSERSEALFLHEYIHLLQDITSVSGLANICVVVDYMKWATNITKKGVLKVPCTPVLQDGKNLLPNAQLKRICAGNGTLKDSYNNHIVWQKTLNLRLEKAGTIIDQQYIEADLQLVIDIQATNGNSYSYHVGEHCISETMAYMIENMIYNNVIESPSDFPYRVVNYVCDYFIPGFTNEPLNVIALCDACLMHSFPGRTLYYGLNFLKQCKGLTPEKIYDIMVSPQLLQATGVSGNIAIEQLLRTRKDEAINQMSGYFTANYDSMITWTTQMLESAFTIRMKNPYFMIEIAQGRDIRNNKTFIDVLNEIGCPVIMNNQNKMFYIRNNNINDNVHPPVFNVISQIYSIMNRDVLKHNTYKCQLMEWCHNDFVATGKKDLTTEGDSCRYAPWERVKEEDIHQCYFGQIWYTWGLKDVVPNNE